MQKVAKEPLFPKIPTTQDQEDQFNKPDITHRTTENRHIHQPSVPTIRPYELERKRSRLIARMSGWCVRRSVKIITEHRASRSRVPPSFSARKNLPAFRCAHSRRAMFPSARAVEQLLLRVTKQAGGRALRFRSLGQFCRASIAVFAAHRVPASTRENGWDR